MSLTYATLQARVSAFAASLLRLGIAKSDRVGIYLDKRFETVVAAFGAAAAGAMFVPLNPLLKPEQVGYILRDCNVRVLVTSPERLATLVADPCRMPRPAPCRRDGDARTSRAAYRRRARRLDARCSTPPRGAGHRVIDIDMAAILYTSGSTGQPKGVVLSHRNMVAGAKSVASYLGNHPDDTLLAALPLSFDAGFSQLTTAFHVGARVVLINYLLPQDVLKALAARARDRPDRRAAAVDPAVAARMARGDRASTCATSRTPAAACRAKRSTRCASTLPQTQARS